MVMSVLVGQLKLAKDILLGAVHGFMTCLLCEPFSGNGSLYKLEVNTIFERM